MPFIGKQPQTGAYSKLDAITTSATATYNLTLDGSAYYPQSANHLLVSLNGVMQAPQDSFTISGSQITFDSALTSSDNIDFIMALGDTLDIGVPSDGSVVTGKLANSAVTATKIGSGAVEGAMVTQIGGRRNLIINGAMQVWQRGTSLGTNFGYLNDRFKGSATDSGVSNYTMVATRTQDSPIGFKGYCSELSLGTGATGINYATYGQRIEASSFHGVNSGDQMTFSFYVKRLQSADSNFTIYVKSAQSGVDSYQASALISQYEDSVASSSLGTFNSLSTSWERKTFTFTVTDDLITNGGQIFLEMGPANLNVSNTNGLYRTTGWQLEVGSVATPFEHRSYGEELQMCKRYFQKINGNEADYVLGHGHEYDSGNLRILSFLGVEMRSQVSLVEESSSQEYRFNGNVGNFNTSGASLALDNNGSRTLTFRISGWTTSITENTQGAVKINSGGTWLACDAEL